MSGPQLAQSDFSATTSGNNNATDLRVGRMGELLVNVALPSLAEMSRKGWLWTATQAAAGVAPGTSATTTTPAFTIWRAATTASRLLLISYDAAYVSGTIGAGHIMFGTVASAAAPTGGTAITTRCTNGDTGTALAVCGTGHTTTAMSASTDRFPVLNLFATLATAPAAGVGSGVDNSMSGNVRGYWLPDGMVGCFYGVAAAGSSPLVRASLLFCEYPISALS